MAQRPPAQSMRVLKEAIANDNTIGTLIGCVMGVPPLLDVVQIHERRMHAGYGVVPSLSVRYICLVAIPKGPSR